MSDLTRFMAKVDKSGDCWLWTGARTYQGYGVFWQGGRNIRAHRVSWNLTQGLIPDGMLVLHKCDNPPCVRPDHLFLGTDADNAADRDAKGRHRAPEPGNRRGSANGNAKLTDADIAAIASLLAEGRTGRAVAARFGVTPQLISEIRTGHIRPEMQPLFVKENT